MDEHDGTARDAAGPGDEVEPFTVVANALDGLHEELAITNARIGQRLLADRERRAGIEVLREELGRAHADAAGRHLQPLLYDLVLLLDRVEREPDSPFLASVRGELAAVLEKYGMARLPGGPDVFDPATQEAVGSVPTPDEGLAGTVAKTVRHGYRMGDRVVRPRQVLVYTITRDRLR